MTQTKKQIYYEISDIRNRRISEASDEQLRKEVELEQQVMYSQAEYDVKPCYCSICKRNRREQVIIDIEAKQ